MKVDVNQYLTPSLLERYQEYKEWVCSTYNKDPSEGKWRGRTRAGFPMTPRPMVVDYLRKLDKNLSFLDAGCGPNLIGRRVPHKVIGFDPADKRNPETLELDFLQAQDYFEDQFDIVTAFNSVHSGIKQSFRDNINGDGDFLLDIDTRTMDVRKEFSKAPPRPMLQFYTTDLEMLDLHFACLYNLTKVGGIIAITVRERYMPSAYVETLASRFNVELIEKYVGAPSEMLDWLIENEDELKEKLTPLQWSSLYVRLYAEREGHTMGYIFRK